MSYATEWTEDVRQQLLAPFAPTEVEFLPRSNGNGMPYVDARVVMRRLDDVFGVGGWTFAYDVVPGPSMMVRGTLIILDVSKSDAGEANGEAELLKSAVSDALKRCAVHFGVGRYLYALKPCKGTMDGKFWARGGEPKINPDNLRHALLSVGYAGPIPNASIAEAQSRPRNTDAPQDPPRTVPAPSNGNGHPALPESRGDAAVTSGPPCAECKAPAGKHATKCSKYVRPGVAH